MDAMKAAMIASHIDAINSPRRSTTKADNDQPASSGDGKPLVSERKTTSGEKNTLLSTSLESRKGRASTKAQRKSVMQDSPYKAPARKPAVEVAGYTPADLASLRGYLQTLKPDHLATSIFREQSSAAKNFPSAWITQVQGSLEGTVDKLLQVILSAAPSDTLPALLPPLDGDDKFDWSGFGELCKTIWKDFSEHLFAMQAMPRLTLGLLVEVTDELGQLPVFLALDAETRGKVVADALFCVYLWNGILSPLMNRVPATHRRLMNLLSVFIKAAYGTTGTTQGESGRKIIGLVQASQSERCASFRQDLMLEINRLAGLRSVVVHDRLDDQQLNVLRERHIDLYFTETWLSRADDYAKQLSKGSYFLTDRNGLTRKCRSYEEFCAYVGPGSKGLLPEVVLHVAGDRIKNFLCRTYLYDIHTPFFTDAHGRQVDPIPDLSTSFTLSCNDAGVVKVRYRCDDHAVDTAMLLAPEQDDVEATPLFPAGIEFTGEMLFHSNEEFESGQVEIKGLNFHMFD